MKKRFVILVGMAVIALLLVGTAAADGPPWPATVVFIPEGGCVMPWLDSDLNIIDIYGGGQGVYQQKNGNWKLTCKFHIDFDDPGIATISDVCSLPVAQPFCNGNGTFIWTDWVCYFGPFTTTDAIYVVNPSGNASASCHFNGSSQ